MVGSFLTVPLRLNCHGKTALSPAAIRARRAPIGLRPIRRTILYEQIIAQQKLFHASIVLPIDEFFQVLWSRQHTPLHSIHATAPFAHCELTGNPVRSPVHSRNFSDWIHNLRVIRDFYEYLVRRGYHGAMGRKCRIYRRSIL